MSEELKDASQPKNNNIIMHEDSLYKIEKTLIYNFF